MGANIIHTKMVSVFKTIPPYYCLVPLLVSDTYSSSTASYALASVAHDPTSSILPCSHHILDALPPGRRSASIQRNIIIQFPIYYVTVFWWRATYVSTSSSPAPTIVEAIGEKIKVLYASICTLDCTPPPESC